MHAFRIIFATLLLAAAGRGQAAQVAPATLADCVDLQPSHQAFSVGTQTLLIQDGDAHYRVRFYGDCPSIGMSQVQISTAGTANRLCPNSTRVTSRTGSCTVRSVEQIDADRYARYRRQTR